MKLMSLELLGFKSFLNRTTFRFNEGVTAIVGPNGCGKSNIVDAMVWVLGERGTKSLRVKEMGDVIFHGSNAKKPVNMAEVTMGLTNEEKEYAVRRRIYRDGTNEYYINGDIVRLKDVQDFFLGTGVGLHSYAIIEQGNIEYFTQMKPQERRVVIEETSGITRFEEKKKDAFFRMEEVKANLERVDDVQREVIKNFERAEEESKRLKIYSGLKERLREIDIALLTDGYIKLEKRAIKLAEREEGLVKELEAKEAEKQSLKDKMGSKDGEISLIDNVSRQLEIDIKGKEKDMESRVLELNYLDGERERLRTLSGDLLNEVAALQGKIEAHSREIEGLVRQIEQETSSLHDVEQRGRSLEARREELRLARERLEKEGEEERNRLFATMTALTEIKNRTLERERAAKEYEARRQKRLAEEKQLHETLSHLEEKMAVLRSRLEEAKSEKALLETQEKDVFEQHEKITKEAGQLRNRIEGLKGVKRGKEEIFRQMKSYGEGRKREAVPFKQLINILKASKETEHVMEKYFSSETEYYVLTERDGINLSIIVKEFGENFIFFPENGMFSLKDGEAEIRLERVESLPEAFERIEGGGQGLFLAGNVLVDSRGFIRRAQDKSAVSIREFREKMKLESELGQLEEELRGHSARLSELQNAQKELEKTRQVLKEKRVSKERSVAAAEKDIILHGAEIKTLKARINEIASMPAFGVEEAPLAQPAYEAEQKAKYEAERAAIEQRLTDLRKALEDAKKAYSETDAEFHQTSIAIERTRNQARKNEEEKSRKKAAVEAFEREKKIKEEKAAETARELRTVMTKAEELEKSHLALQEECRTAVARYEEMKAKLGDLHMEKGVLQEELAAVDQDIEKAKGRWEAIEREKLVLQEKRETILERLRLDYGIEKVEEAPPSGLKDEAERERIVSELSALGDVNFRADKEYGELKERLEFLDRQKTDLTQAMESLKKTIAKIDSLSRDLFLETFERVNDAFKRFAHTLFKGGKGMLVLNQETGGVELYVQPPGKKVTRMELLSGGEKALISMSFLLALMDTKASPFTLMDEIDAPLDDANLLSLLDIVKDISRKTQIVLITHNRMTMESANTIYGVTMEDDGISKTISIKL